MARGIFSSWARSKNIWHIITVALHWHAAHIGPQIINVMFPIVWINICQLSSKVAYPFSKLWSDEGGVSDWYGGYTWLQTCGQMAKGWEVGAEGILDFKLVVRWQRGWGAGWVGGVLVCFTSNLWSEGKGVGDLREYWSALPQTYGQMAKGWVLGENWSAYPQPCSQMVKGWGFWGRTGLLNLNLAVRW